MFGKVAAFEFRYQLRQPAFWVISILFFLLSFGLVASPNVSLGTGGNVFKNAPYAIAQAHLAFNLFFMLATTAIVANVVVRDATTGFGPMIQASRLSKFDYLYGRFLGAFAVVALAFLSVALGILIGTLMPWVDKETVGPFRPLDYLYGFVVMGLPGLLFSSAVFFTLATVTRSMMATYVGRRRGLHPLHDHDFGVRLQAGAGDPGGLAGAVRRRGLWPGDQVLDGSRAQHDQRAPDRPAAGQQAAVARRQPGLPRRRLAPVQSVAAWIEAAQAGKAEGLGRSLARHDGAGRAPWPSPPTASRPVGPS